MNLCVCMYVCTYVSMYARTHALMYECMHVCMHACLLVLVPVFVYTSLCVGIVRIIEGMNIVVVLAYSDTSGRITSQGLLD